MKSATPPRLETPGATEAAFFDLDKTIIAKAAMAAFRRPLYAGGLVNRRSLTRSVFAHFVYLHLRASEQRSDQMRRSILRITKGWKREEVVGIVEETLEEIVDPIIFAEAMDLIDAHLAKGRLVVIVSSSPIEIVGPLGHHLGITETIASTAEVDEEGRYTGEMDYYAYGSEKARAMRELALSRGIDLARSYAYSDSFTDLPMLEVVGHPTAVNPDRVLAKLAAERGWEVIHFVRPIRLRDRVRDRVNVTPKQSGIAIGVGAALTACAVIVLTWWTLRKRRGEAPLLQSRYTL
jgi:HAD superfamily hydrolase (TIGR01490 family)